MVQKGFARPIKKILGWVLLFLGVTNIFNIGIYISLSKTVIGVLMILAAYFLIIAGRRD